MTAMYKTANIMIKSYYFVPFTLTWNVSTNTEKHLRDLHQNLSSLSLTEQWNWLNRFILIIVAILRFISLSVSCSPSGSRC